MCRNKVCLPLSNVFLIQALPHRAEIIHWVSKNLCPFNIVNNQAFWSLMKIGHLEYHLPSKETVLHDVKLVFAHTRKRITKMLNVSLTHLTVLTHWLTYQEYEDQISFTTNRWTSSNHCAFVAFSVHLQNAGKPLSFPLDVVEIARVYISYILV